ncbi:MAG: glutamyl-tRNA synthetase [Thermoleophilia bacterium]|nr:glutamyl-tRNA synthetase [Thermoleophilia bacterium]
MGTASNGYRRDVTLRPSTEPGVRVRFAPSPTGALHLGSAFVALANRAFADAQGGAFVLRIDDTDQSRSREEDTDELLRLLRWLEVDWEEGPLRQHDRGDIYAAALDRLIEGGHAYPCFCGAARLAELRADQERAGEPPRYDGRCRVLAREEADRSVAEGAPHVLRFAVPEGRDVEVDDLVHGRVVVPSGSFGDPILCRADGSPGYLLASVVDDIDLAITHVVRGEDHLPNAARQLLLFEALGAPSMPTFAHLPLLRDTDGRKLSKRDPLGTLDELADEGFLPVTVRRYLAELLGQGPVDLLDGERDADGFRIERVPTGAPRVDRARLESLGREDMAQLDTSTLLLGTNLDPTPEREPVVRELAVASPSRVALRGELRLVFDGPGAGDLPHVLRIFAPDAATLDAADAALVVVIEQLRHEIASGPEAGVDSVWAAPFLARTRAEAKELGIGTRDLLRPLRIALTGTTSGPGLELVLTAVGAREALRRVHLACTIIDELRGGKQAVVG